MPQRRSAIKELRKNRKRHLHNLDIKTDLKKTIKHFLKSVQSKNIQDAKNNLKTVYKKLDKAVKKNVLHKRTAANRKSRFSRLIAGIG